ncbi:MAG TPA: ABC transporter substrate binding protein, partial [Pyrinomonadaceae bacterium]|nr:ABC transporter substrate binding protein [Pyrinomonadaceae bacterium]
MLDRNSLRLRSLVVLTAVLACVVISSFAVAVLAQPAPKRVLVLYWYNKDYPWNVRFDQSFQARLRPGVEYYSEYLENNRFPGDNQAVILRDYLRQKYADRPIDVVVATSDASLDFLTKYRSELFPHSPIVFIAAKHPDPETLTAFPGMTGIININTHKETLDLALKLHPNTQQVFIISGSLDHDKHFEKLAREELANYQSRPSIAYLTDLEPNELVARVSSLPPKSIILYVWQQARNDEGRVLEAGEVLGLVAQSTNLPIYGMSQPSIGAGSIGGYINTAEAIGARTAEIVQKITEGTRAQDIPVQNAPTIPVFDWRQLQRWGISEKELPPGNVISFKELSFWQQYKWQIMGVVALVTVQALLIVTLLVQRSRRSGAEHSRQLSEEKFSKAFRSSPDAFVITRRSDEVILEVNDRWEALFGFPRPEALGRTPMDLNLYANPADRERILSQIVNESYVRDFETNIRTKTGQLRPVILSSESIVINKEPCLLIIIRDVTELKNSERALRNMTGQLIHLRDEEQRRIAAELHDGLGQRLSIIRNRAIICMMDMSDHESVHEQLEEISSTALSGIDEVREIAHNLRPYELDRLGLASAVESMVRKVSDATSMQLSTDLDQIDGLLSSAAEISVYRIVQEGLNNVIKHAEASEARVGIKRVNGEVVVSIQDNGKGIGPSREARSESNGGFGLAGIAERARMLGARHKIDSTPG